MPGMDGTEPMGMGPMTGGARGWCNPCFAGWESSIAFPHFGFNGEGMNLGFGGFLPSWPYLGIGWAGWDLLGSYGEYGPPAGYAMAWTPVPFPFRGFGPWPPYDGPGPGWGPDD
jgi:hypothetical protein